MKIVDLTGNNSAAIGFSVSTNEAGIVVGKLTVGMLPVPGAIGERVGNNVPVAQELEIHFDKPESVAVFINRMTKGYNTMGYRIMQEQARSEALARAAKDNEKAAKQAALAGRIEQMARELSALQGQYAELQD